jgi:hypothetical protein
MEATCRHDRLNCEARVEFLGERCHVVVLAWSLASVVQAWHGFCVGGFYVERE